MEILNLPEHIRILEELLLHQDFSASPGQLEAMLGAEFREIDPKGREVPRGQVIEWLLGKDPAARWEFTDFDVQTLAEGLVLATYRACQIQPQGASGGGAMHCSIWREKLPGKTWQLVFHQSTRLA